MKNVYEKMTITALDVCCSGAILSDSYVEVSSAVTVESLDAHNGFDSLESGSFEVAFD